MNYINSYVLSIEGSTIGLIRIPDNWMNHKITEKYRDIYYAKYYGKGGGDGQLGKK